MQAAHRARTHGPGRRALLAGGGLGLTGALAACAPSVGAATANSGPTIPAAKGKVTLTYWAWLKDLQKVCDVFNRSQDRIEVRASWIPGGNDGGYAKILSAVSAGGGPDIAQVELRSVPEFALDGALTDLSRYGALDLEDRFDPGAIAQVKVGDSIWAIPQDTGPCANFYNREILEDKLDLTPPRSWDDFRTVSEAVKDSGRTFITIDPGDASYLVSWMMQAGADWFRPEGEGWVVEPTSDATVKVAEFWDQILADGLVGTGYGPFSTPWMAAAGSGDVLGFIGGSWGDALIESVPHAKGKWAVADMPRWDDGFASGAHGGSSASVLSTSQHPAEALEFLTWMCSEPAGIDALIEYSGIGWSPAKDYIGKQREKPSEFFSGQDYNQDVILPMAKGQNLDWSWSPILQRAMALYGDAMLEVVGGQKKLVDVVPAAVETAAGIMQEMGLDVEVRR